MLLRGVRLLHARKTSSFLSKNEAVDSLVTIGDFYRFAVTRFNQSSLHFGHTTLSPAEDASFLIMHELHLPLKDPIAKWESFRLLKSEKERLLDVILQRIDTKMPTEYIVNGCLQQGEYFYVDSRTIIPRSYIGEILFSKSLNVIGDNDVKPVPQVELSYEDYFGIDIVNSKSQRTQDGTFSSPLVLKQNIKSVLDLCTGSGCLAILAAIAFPNATRIDAVDISSDALEVAKINVEMKQLEERINLFQGNLFQPLLTSSSSSSTSQRSVCKYDLIITNPPYVSTERMKHVYATKEYSYEPKIAFDGGKDGLKIIRSILTQSYDYLADDERSGLLCEVGACKSALEREYPKLFGNTGSSSGNVHDSKNSNSSYNSGSSYNNNKFPCRVTWIDTAHSKGEVFYVQKKYLHKQYLKVT